jgi:hypothetical protein
MEKELPAQLQNKNIFRIEGILYKKGDMDANLFLSTLPQMYVRCTGILSSLFSCFIPNVSLSVRIRPKK